MGRFKLALLQVSTVALGAVNCNFFGGKNKTKKASLTPTFYFFFYLKKEKS